MKSRKVIRAIKAMEAVKAKEVKKYTVTAKTSSGSQIAPFHGNTKHGLRYGISFMKKNPESYSDIKITKNQ